MQLLSDGIRRVAIAIMLLLLDSPLAQARYVEPVTDRVQTLLDSNWQFTASNSLTGAEAPAYDDSGWKTITIPHTWNSVDANANPIADFSNAWYRSHVAIPRGDAGKRIYIKFEGAFQIADVYVNGRHLGQHRGGYTGFTFDATPAIAFGGDNVIAVMVSNKECADCLPDGNTRLFKGYGGIYRKAWLIKTSKYQVSTTDFSSSGVYITPSDVNEKSATVSIRTVVRNSGVTSKTFTVKNSLSDRAENVVLTLQKEVMVAPNASVSVTQTGQVRTPELWSKSHPALYNVHADIVVDGKVTDSVHEHTGLRAFHLSANDFTVNGVSARLRGISKHQESEVSASAMSDAELIADWDNIADLGVNFVRLPHYPHARLEYDLADQRGLVVWAENGHTNGGPPTANGDNITREMIYQNWNHPSIAFWSAGNESLSDAATSQYAAVIKATDRSRPAVYASNGQHPSGLDYTFSNLYPGWYGGSMYDFLNAPDTWISESGAGMVVATHTPDYFAMQHTPDSFEPEEYGQLNNEVKFQSIFVTNATRIAAFANWVFRDFGDNKYKNHMNAKGFLTLSNYKKDIYYHFKSFLTETPLLHVVGADYFLRDANEKGQGAVKVYANTPHVRLTVNGVDRGVMEDGAYRHPNGTVINHVFYWADALLPGRNDIMADDGKGHTDAISIYFKGRGGVMPPEPAAKVANLRSDNPASAAYFINRAVADQEPFYFDFDGSGDNTFDHVPPLLAGAGWIATKRQSDPAKTTRLTFDLPVGGDVFLMATRQDTPALWIGRAGFSDTGVVGKWRNNDMKLVPYQLFKKTFPPGSHVALDSSPLDYVILVK